MWYTLRNPSTQEMEEGDPGAGQESKRQFSIYTQWTASVLEVSPAVDDNVDETLKWSK